jgi:hypothetical protein
VTSTIAAPVATHAAAQAQTTSAASNGSTANNAAQNQATSSTTNLGAQGQAAPLPSPPPPSVTVPLAAQGVPPTPAPAFPGLPAPTSSGAVLPSAQGLGADVESQLRPSAAGTTQQVVNLQAALAAGGFYRGPLDGVLGASTRAGIREFQLAAQLPATGLLDAETLARLTGTVPTTTPTGSAGLTSTAGNQIGTFTQFSAGGVVPTPTTGTTGASVPFGLSNPLNMSPNPPAGITVQP